MASDISRAQVMTGNAIYSYRKYSWEGQPAQPSKGYVCVEGPLPTGWHALIVIVRRVWFLPAVI